jgi:hypothetical protein
MKRANIKAFNQFYTGFILIESHGELIDFFHEKTTGMIKDSARSLVDRAQAKAREENVPSKGVDAITRGTETIADIKKQGLLYQQACLMGTYQSTLEREILSGNTLVINPFNFVSWFVLPKNAEVEIISEKETYTKDDIRLFRFPNGGHWYAKISKIDVVVNGEQKWNARYIAQQKAEEFLKTL